MRLTPFERDTLKQAAQTSFEPSVLVRLFGSRVDDSRKGGDIDLLIETQWSDPARIATAHTRFLAMVYARLGEQKVDVLMDYPNRQQRPAIFEVAKREGVLL